MISGIAVNWTTVGHSLLRTFIGFAALYVPHYIAKVLTEYHRKESVQSRRMQYLRVYGVAISILIGIGFFALSFLSDNEETGEDIPPSSWRRAETTTVILVVTLALPIFLGIFRGFQTPQSEVDKLPRPEPDRWDNQ